VVDRTIRTILRAEIADFKRKMGEAASVVDKNAAGIDTLSNQVGVLGGALTGFAALAVTRFAQFDKQMSSVQAATRATGAELDSLRQAAIRAGADTAFSATEAAAGIEELAKAGVSTADILNGGLTGALNLAAAGELEVADAAQIAAVTLKQFNLEGSDVSHIADLLSAGAGKAVGSVSDLSQALNQSGLIASQTGLSIEETTAGLSAFASAGLLGSDAGTSFKTMLQVLAAPSSTAANEMERLGINAYDAQGNFIGLEGLAGNLRSSLAGLTTEQKNSALATIFGSDAVRAASVLYSQGALGIQQWTDAVDEQGFAAEQARIQSDNLIGDLERLGGSFDTVLIQSGSGINDSLRLIVQGAEAAVDAVGQIPAPVLSTVTAIAGAGGLALVGVAGLGKLTVGFAEAKNAAEALGVSTKVAGVAAGGLGAVIAATGVGLAIMAQRAAESQGRVEQLAQTWDEAGRATTATNNLINESLTKQTDNLVDGNRTLIELADQVGVSTEDLIGYIEGEADAIDRVNAATDEYANQGGWIGAIAQRSTESSNLRKELDDLSGEYVRSKEVSELDARAKEAGAEATEGATAATQEATGALQENTEALDENWQAQMDASGAVLSLRDAENAAEAAYDDATEALKDNGRTLDVTTEKGRANRAALDAIAKSGFDVVDSIRSTGGSLKDVQGAMATARQRFIETATSMGLGEKAANRLADELKLIPKNVTTTATVNTGNALAQVATLDNTLNRIDGKVVTAAVALKQYGQAAMATGGRLPGFPTGGRLPGIPPANPMQDNLLGVDGAGMPKVRVRSREWVVSQPAADYYGDGIMGALNAREIPREAFSGLLGLARGGEVGASQRGVDKAWDSLRRARAAARRARDAVREAEAAERRARRTESEADDRAAERKAREAQRALDRAEKRVQEAESRVDDATARRDRLRQERADVGTQLRRGELRDSVTGGLSGAIGVTDQLRDLANSGDVGRWRQNRLRDVAGNAEKALTSLYKQAERIDAKIASAVDRLEMLKQVQSQVQSALVGGFGLDQVQGAVNPWSGQEGPVTGQALVAAAEQYKGKVQKFSGLLKRLQEAGAGGAILQEVASYGVEQGIPIAEALLSLPKGQLKGLAQTYSDIERFAGYAGASVARAVGGAQGGLYEAEQAVKAAEAQADAIDKRIGNWAKILGNELARALGIKPRADGGPVTAGSAYLVNENTPRSEIFVAPQSGYILNQQQAMTAMGGRPGTTINVTNVYPQAEPTSKTVNRGLQYAAALDR
jgi:TP901 family phage tail tape measure protein